MKYFIGLIVTKIKGILKWIVIGQVLTATVFVSVIGYKSIKEELLFNALQDEAFSEYIIYTSVLPASSLYYGGNYFVEHSSIARAQSNFRIFKVPKTGLSVSWEEIIECDFEPLDGEIKYTPFALIQSSSRTYTKEKIVKSVLNGRGYTLKDALTGEDIKYPPNDANCRTEIVVMQKHIRDEVKILTFYSEIVYVRDLSKLDNG